MVYKTSFGRAILAMLCGALVGGNLSMGLLMAGFGPPAQSEFLQIWLIMQVYWLGGIVLFALIPFVLLHISNLRNWYGLTSVGVLTMVSLSFYAFKGIEAGSGMVFLAIIGGVVGWVIWRVAYRRHAPLEDTE